MPTPQPKTSTRPRIKAGNTITNQSPNIRRGNKKKQITNQPVKTKTITNPKGAGAPLGNDNPFKGKLWKAAINNALEIRGRGERMGALVKIADKLISLSLLGSMPAIRELGDRLDGKPAQMLIGDPENPLQFNDQTQLTNSARVTRLMQVLALQDPNDAKSAFAALKAKARPKIAKKK